MNLTDAARMILTEAAGHPELLRDARLAHDESAAGRQVPPVLLARMLKEVVREDVLPALRARHGGPACDEMVTVLAMEVDRRSPVPARP